MSWSEPGVVWVQEDKNGNNIPDEIWYGLKGGDGLVNEYGQLIRKICWADGGTFGEVSTEVRSADFIGQQSYFPLP